MQVYSHIDGGMKIVFRYPYYDLTTSAAWLSGSGGGDTVLFYNDVTQNMDAIYHTITLSEPVPFDDQTGWGTLYYAIKNVSDDILPPFYYLH